MRGNTKGFTLIELMIVIAIIAIIAAIAIPNLLSARLNSNETAAIATLRNIISAESQFPTTARADDNNNGVGEYGTFAEMSGAVGVRGGAVLNPPVLSTAFRTVNANGEVTRSGYLFQMYLPDVNGDGVAEAASGGVGAGVDPDLAGRPGAAMPGRPTSATRATAASSWTRVATSWRPRTRPRAAPARARLPTRRRPGRRRDDHGQRRDGHDRS